MSAPPLNFGRESNTGKNPITPSSPPVSPDPVGFTPESLRAAEEWCQAILSSDGPTTRGNLIEALLLRGRTLHARRRYQLAIKDWEAVLRLDEFNITALRLLDQSEDSTENASAPAGVRALPPIPAPLTPSASRPAGSPRAPNLVHRIKVLRRRDRKVLGYLDASADWGPIENARHFLIPKTGYGAIEFATPTLHGAIRGSNEYITITSGKFLSAALPLSSEENVLWNLSGNIISPDREVLCSRSPSVQTGRTRIRLVPLVFDPQAAEPECRGGVEIGDLVLDDGPIPRSD